MRDITRGVRAFTIGTGISRVFGLLRESVFAYLFGAGMATDAFNAAFRIPNLFRDLFAETALSAAFIPVLSAEQKKSKHAQNLLASNIINILLLIVGGVVLCGIVFAPYVVKVVAFGFGSVPDKIGLTAQLTSLMFPFLLFVSMAAWAMGYLNTENEFFIPAIAPAFFNIMSIAIPIITYVYLTQRGLNPIFGMAIGVTLGGFIQFAIQVPRLYHKGFRYYFYVDFKDPAFRRILTLFIPAALGLAASRINVTIDTFLISLLAEGSMTWLNYAYRIMHLPLGLFGIAVGTVTLPTVSKLVIEKKDAEVRAMLFDSLRLVFFLTITTSIIIACLSMPITRLLYERGKFTAFDTVSCTQALVLYIIGIPFLAAIRNIAAVFYAYKDSRTPMFASIAAVISNIILNLTLMQVIGFRAFPLATTISALFNIIILIIALPKKIGRFSIKPLIIFFLTLTVSSVIGGVIGILVNNLLQRFLGLSFLSQGLNIFVILALALILSLLIARLFGLKDIELYLRRLIKK